MALSHAVLWEGNCHFSVRWPSNVLALNCTWKAFFPNPTTLFSSKPFVALFYFIPSWFDMQTCARYDVVDEFLWKSNDHFFFSRLHIIYSYELVQMNDRFIYYIQRLTSYCFLMLVKRLSFATILLANSSFNVSALVNSWSCRPSSAWRKACWETIVESDGGQELEWSMPSAACSGSLVLWLAMSWSRKAIIQLLTKRSHENQAHPQVRVHK